MVYGSGAWCMVQHLSRMSGTQNMTVGWRTVASPLWPFLIMVDLSVRVFGWE